MRFQKMTLSGALLYSALLSGTQVLADDVEIVDATARQNGNTWSFSVTLKHGDAGWDHYADAWRLIDAAGNELGRRTLLHPHVDEQPFTRALRAVELSTSLEELYVEAHDSVHGWSSDRVQVLLTQPKGERYQITR